MELWKSPQNWRDVGTPAVNSPQRTNENNRFNSLQLPRKVHRVWKTSARKPAEFCISPLSCRVCAPRHLSLHWSWQGSCTKLLKKHGTLQSSELFTVILFLFQAVSHKLVLTYLPLQWVVKGYIILIKISSKGGRQRAHLPTKQGWKGTK